MGRAGDTSGLGSGRLAGFELSGLDEMLCHYDDMTRGGTACSWLVEDDRDIY